MSPKRDRGAPRRPSRAAVRRELLVFVEGARTEEAYLTEWRRRHRDTVNVVISEFIGPPLKLVERAVETRQRDEQAAHRSHGRAYDEYWCVFDVDEHHGLAEAVRRAHDNGIKVAVSNPNIELWFILHFEDRTAPIHRSEATARAQELLGCGKRLTPEATQKLAATFAAAATRARQLDVKHEGDGSPKGANPSSGVWRLVDAIRRAPPPRERPPQGG